ncbi:MAG TPA: OmpA family protein [Deltaproteobacteria bacterium]|nr:OmpA family protein [Deltaproteobacteria bacterium]
MKKTILKLLLLLIVGSLMMGCGARGYRMETDVFTPHRFAADQYLKKVDNFLVILDVSSSMLETYNNSSKFYLAKNTIYKMNLTIPDLDLTSGLRKFSRVPILGRKPTELVYGMTKYTKEGLNGGLEAAKWASGTTPMAVAIDAANNDLKSVPGYTAVIIVGDGLENNGSALIAAKTLKDKYLNRICIYTIHVGDNPKGKSLMEELARIGGCGFSVNADDLASSKGMADFVEKVFLVKVEKAKKAETVKTIEKVKPVAAVVRLDSDGDGVYDDLDKCPGTPKGAKVDERGCWTLGNVLFDFDKWNIKQKFTHLLDHVVDVLKKNPYLKLKLEGHTCSIGPEAYNQGLSARRAGSVEKYIEGKGIEASRVESVGHGETRPAYSNATQEGRANNRRVELTPGD